MSEMLVICCLMCDILHLLKGTVHVSCIICTDRLWLPVKAKTKRNEHNPILTPFFFMTFIDTSKTSWLRHFSPRRESCRSTRMPMVSLQPSCSSCQKWWIPGISTAWWSSHWQAAWAKGATHTTYHVSLCIYIYMYLLYNYMIAH